MDLVSKFPMKSYFKNLLIFASCSLLARTLEDLQTTKTIQKCLSYVRAKNYISSVPVSVPKLSMGVLLKQKKVWKQGNSKKHNPL